MFWEFLKISLVLSSRRVLSKDPTVWLDVARSANTYIPPCFPRSLLAQPHGEPTNLACLRVYDNVCLQVLKKELG